MPELPEIETVKLQLQQVLPGQVLSDYTVLGTKVLQGDIGILKGKSVKEVKRAGKVLLINFGQDLSLGFHFKMTGQLIYDDGKKRIVGGHPTEDFVNKSPSSHTRIIFKFSNPPSRKASEGRGGTLYFNDQRMFGWVALNPKFIDKLGPEPFDIDLKEFVKRIGKTKRPIKIAIMDQEIISGVGNIYACDALWESRIYPRLPSNQLTSNQLSILLEKIKLVLREGIKYGGATASDAKYMDLHGLGGHYQEHFRVYDRTGLPCLRCKTPIEKIVLGGRGTYFCPVCQ